MKSAFSQTGREIFRDLLLLTALLCILFGTMLGSRPLSVPDEGRYVEIPREMVATGDYVTPRLNGVKYLEKPVLFYWLEALSIRLFGINEFTLRLWPALFALTGCLAVYAAGRRLYDRRTGLLASAVLATSILYYILSRVIILDMPLSAFLTAALLLFLTGTHEPAGTRRRLFFMGFYACTAFAVLTKGLVGMVIPGLIIGAWVLLLGQWRILSTIYLPSGALLFLIIAAPWHILVGRANPEFFNFYFVHEHFLRYLTTVHRRYEPSWFFIPVLVAGLFPWSAFLLQALRFSMPRPWSTRREHGDALFLLLWAGLVLLFFSASGSKLPPYILPAFPPLALLIGRYLAAAWDRSDLAGVRAGLASALILMFTLAVAFLALPAARPVPEVLALGRFPALLAAVLATGGVATGVLYRAKGFPWALPSLVITTSLLLMAGNSAADRIESRSAKPLVDVLKNRLSPGDEVASFGMYYQDVPVYLERRITVTNWKGELAFGMGQEDTSPWIIDTDAFWERWYGPRTMYLFTKKDIYEIMRLNGHRNLFLIAETGKAVLVTNKEKKQ